MWFFLAGLLCAATFAMLLRLRRTQSALEQAYLSLADKTMDAGMFEPLDSVDDLGRVVSVATVFLDMQKSLLTKSSGNLPNSACDMWSCGYVAGCIWAVMALARNNDEDLAPRALAKTFAAVFGARRGAELFADFLRAHELLDEQALQGSDRAWNDLQAFLAPDTAYEFGWSDHVMKLSKDLTAPDFTGTVELFD